jgi:hypothetical protein
MISSCKNSIYHIKYEGFILSTVAVTALACFKAKNFKACHKNNMKDAMAKTVNNHCLITSLHQQFRIHIYSQKKTLLIVSRWCNCYMKAMSLKPLSLIILIQFLILLYFIDFGRTFYCATFDICSPVFRKSTFYRLFFVRLDNGN